ncbi:alcohol dehydrogenase [Niastella koreensis]|uniref:Alcohol dehydrogenase zinc-binding domain protein n=2 Tax=Niastella koreensis TaxID=354356 RepID=G8TLV3_NIAKG|nr:NAD(P)-dependent alcohol dehydrogenase [Niastella koreensis]AEV97695.1 Alcohol dehydrogenase zinc-binding domain protein [Niastella koreensis GR20-10]OQP40484.1 alcohol dehydrogenase [Niastella koreensis]
MKKITYNRFGGTDVLQLTEAPMPAGEIIVKVKAVSINPLDWKLWQGEMKLMSGRTFPKSVGIDFAGIVEQGNGKFRTGDEVFGIASIFKGGALAEYVAVKASDLTHKPKAITFEEAASLPVAGLAALQIFDKLLNIQPGMQVLINGAGGGIGPFAIQLAKKAGAIVTAVAGPAALELVTKLGSDVVINYQQQNVLTSGKRFDAIIDLAGTMTYKTAKPILTKKGIYVNTSPGPKEMIGSLFSGGRYKLLMLKPLAASLEKLASAGLQVTISKRYDFRDYKKAYDEVKRGGIVGKAVFVVS